VIVFLGRDVQWLTLADTWTVPVLHGSASGVGVRYVSGVGAIACLDGDVDSADDARLL